MSGWISPNLFRRISPPETSRNRDGNKLGAIIIISSQRKATVENDKVEDDNDMEEGGNFVVVCWMDDVTWTGRRNFQGCLGLVEGRKWSPSGGK